jgi:hypothetical protein
MNFVSSRGLAKICARKNNTLKSSSPHIDHTLFNTLKDGDSIYICNTAIPNFVFNFLPRLNCKIVLVSGDSDDLINTSNNVKTILNNPLILHWYIQNCCFTHPKVTKMPIGMDYHTIANGLCDGWGKQKSEMDQEQDLIHLRNTMVPFEKRKILCYANYHFVLSRGDRALAYNEIPKELVYYEPAFVQRIVSWNKQLDYAFVISPFGCGMDCHRTWEALLLGCIPIIRHSAIDDLFNDLPVLFVDKWSDVTQQLLEDTIIQFRAKPFDYEKLQLSYWNRKINGV